MTPPTPTDPDLNQARGMQELSMLLHVSRILDQSLDLREVVPPVLSALADHLNLKHGTLTLLNRASGDILIESAHGIPAQRARKIRYKLGEGVTGKVVQTGEPAVIEQTDQSPLFLDKTRRGKSPSTSFICVPIKVGTEVAGALSVDRDFEAGHDLHSDVRLLTITASLIAQAVKLRREAQERNDRLLDENERLRAELKDRFRPSNIIGNSHEMQIVYDQIAQVSKSTATVLIEGETGTGKELIAHAIHYNSERSAKAFIKAHCAALPENLIESELFGHVKGAFTGAHADRKGRFELAHGGTLFLDEIGDISPAIQVKLLRVLQEREFEPVGGTDTRRVNVRLLAATNRNLPDLVADGRFREDLYYRLNIFPIYAPPLRKRKADIVQLADHFLEKYARETGRTIRRLSSPVIDMLMSYHWPGNVRELENVIERSVIVAEGDVILPHHMPPTLQTAEAAPSRNQDTLDAMISAFERDVIRDNLKSTRGNIAAAARILGSTPRIIGYKVKKYGIEPKEFS